MLGFTYSILLLDNLRHCFGHWIMTSQGMLTRAQCCVLGQDTSYLLLSTG